MAQLNPYLIFDGKCREAMNFYKSCFGGELHLSTYADAPGCPDGARDQIIHANLKSPGFLLMASDSGRPGTKTTAGDNVHLSVNCASADEIEKLFNAVGAGGEVLMPLQDMFWGARFGMLIDRFGIHWMFNCEKK